MAKIALFIVLLSMIMIHSAQVVVSDNEPSAAPIADVVAVSGPVSGSESSPAPAPAPTPKTTTKFMEPKLGEANKKSEQFRNCFTDLNDCKNLFETENVTPLQGTGKWWMCILRGSGVEVGRDLVLLG
ncbi:hypothetical protein V6N11_027226 [Hibiscus sabdariffa]|uniref:Uncharacterized protein n=1 Tax=Hibiscus sabdariffa TaxID=183260 RepID=A0ABR2PGA5_9ROSI